MNINDSVFIECECYSEEHTLKYNIDVEDQTIYTSVFLNQYLSWYDRAWIALKYLFGYKCIYGHFDCTLMGPEKIDQLKKLLKSYDDLCFPDNQEHEIVNDVQEPLVKSITVNNITKQLISDYISYESVIYISDVGFKHPESKITYTCNSSYPLEKILRNNEHVLLEDGMVFKVVDGDYKDVLKKNSLVDDYHY